MSGSILAWNARLREGKTEPVGKLANISLEPKWIRGPTKTMPENRSGLSRVNRRLNIPPIECATQKVLLKESCTLVLRINRIVWVLGKA